MSVVSALPTALAIVNGVIRLGREIDQISAENLVNQAPLALAIPEYVGREIENPDLWKIFTDLKKLATSPDDGTDLLKLTAEELALLNTLITALDDSEGVLVQEALQGYEGVFKVHAIAVGIDWEPEKTFREELIAVFPEWENRPEELLAIQFIRAGGSAQQSNAGKTTWRLARVLLDLFADFGGSHTQLIVKDEKWRPVIGAILTEFGGANIGDENFSPGDVMKVAFTSTVSGILEARDSMDVKSKWLASFLESLAGMRDEMNQDSATAFDSFALGLFQNKGYPKLVSAILDASTAGLESNLASSYLAQVSGMLKEAEGDLDDFLKSHWSDLLRGAFKSLSENADLMISPDDSELANSVLKEVLQGLSENQNLSRIALAPGDLFTVIAQEAVSAIAANKNLWEGEIEKPWLRELVTQAVDLIDDDGIRSVLSEQGLANLLREIIHETAGVIAKNPALLGDEIGEKWLRQLAPALVESLTDQDVFKKWGQGDLKMLVTSIADTAVTTFAADPSLLTGDVNEKWLKDLISGALDFAAKGGVAEMLTPAGSKRLFNAVLTKGAEAVVTNPELLRIKEPWLQNLVKQLAPAIATSGPRLHLSPEKLADLGIALVDAALQNTSLLADEEQNKKLGSFLRKFLKAAADQGGGTQLLSIASGVIAENPEIVLRDDATKAMVKLTSEVVGALSTGIENRTAGLGVIEAMLASSLRVLADHPEVVGNRLPGMVSSLATTLLIFVEGGQLKPALAQKLAEQFPVLLLENAAFNFSKHRTLPGRVVGLILEIRGSLIEQDASGGEVSLVLNSLLAEIVGEALKGIAAIAKEKFDLTADKALALLESEFEPLIREGLEKLMARIGDGISGGQVPIILKGLILDWGMAATGETIDLDALINQKISQLI